MRRVSPKRRKHTIYDDKFIKGSRLITTLGSGTYGSVGLYETEDGQRVIKKTKKHQDKSSYPIDFINELDALTKFSFLPHVVDYVGVAFGEKKQAGYIVMDKCDTTLSGWKKMNTSFARRVSHLEPLMRQIGETLAIMHSMEFVHGDLKSNNILIKFRGNIPEDIDNYIDVGSSTESITYSSDEHVGPTSFTNSEVVSVMSLTESMDSPTQQYHSNNNNHRDLYDRDIISLTPTQLDFYLADFGFATYCRNYPEEVRYTGIQRVRPPTVRNLYTSEYWAFMVTCVELITGRGLVRITPRDTKDSISRKMKKFYRRYSDRDGVFQLREYLMDELLPDEEDDLLLQMIPDTFWKFFEPVLTNKKASIIDGFNNCGWSVNFGILKNGRFRVKRKNHHEQMKYVKDDYDYWFGNDDMDQEFRTRTEDLLNFFLYSFDLEQERKFNSNPLDSGIKKLNEATIKHYGEVAYILLNGEEQKDINSYRYFKNKNDYCKFERHFLEMVQYQINILEHLPQY